MSVQLSRNNVQAASNDLNVLDQPWTYYSKSYSGSGPQETIYIPDVVGCSVTLTGGSAWVEFTDSSPSLIDAGLGVWVVWPLGTISTTGSSYIQGATAVRANFISGGATIMVRV